MSEGPGFRYIVLTERDSGQYWVCIQHDGHAWLRMIARFGDLGRAESYAEFENENIEAVPEILAEDEKEAPPSLPLPASALARLSYRPPRDEMTDEELTARTWALANAYYREEPEDEQSVELESPAERPPEPDDPPSESDEAAQAVGHLQSPRYRANRQALKAIEADTGDRSSLVFDDPPFERSALAAKQREAPKKELGLDRE